MLTRSSCAPIVIVLDLPTPPSVNRIWRHAKAGKSAVSRSAEYKAWLGRADVHTMATAQLRGTRRINGPFAVDMVVARTRGDLDNRIKGVLDWCQSRFVVRDDKYVEDIHLRWGSSATAPLGCRITLTELSS